MMANDVVRDLELVGRHLHGRELAVHVRVHVCACVCACVRMCVHAHVCMCVCILVYVYSHAPVPWNVCRGQRATSMNQFFPSTLNSGH